MPSVRGHLFTSPGNRIDLDTNQLNRKQAQLAEFIEQIPTADLTDNDRRKSSMITSALGAPSGHVRSSRGAAVQTPSALHAFVGWIKRNSI